VTRTVLALWLPAALAAPVLAFAAYALIQADLRASGNDPQIGVAQQAAAQLAAGASPASVAAGASVDIARSAAVDMRIFDAQGNLVASTATLDGGVPALPPGILEAARARGEDRVTWQPRPGVRSALVVVPYPGGAVAVGRSLAEVEARETSAGHIAAALCVLALAASAAGALAGARLLRA